MNTSNHTPRLPEDDTSDLVTSELNANDIWASWNAKGNQGQRKASSHEADEQARNDVEQS